MVHYAYYPSTTRRGCVFGESLHKSWLHYAVMCVCVLVVGKQRRGSLQVSCGINFMMVPVREGLARLCTQERNMSSIRNEPYVHTHIPTHTHTLCINVWSRLWIIDASLLFVPLVSCGPPSLSVHPSLPSSLINPVLCLSIPQDAAASLKPSWLDEEKTTDYQHGRAPSWSFPQSLVLW